MQTADLNHADEFVRGIATRNIARERAVAVLPSALAQLRIDPLSKVSVTEQICRAIRQAIEAGDLPAGAKMPTGRELGRALGVSRNTIVSVYSRLTAESFLVSNRRRGTHVQGAAIDPALLQSSRRENARKFPSAAELHISHRAREELKSSSVSAGEIGPFALHVPDPSLFPRNILLRHLSEEFRRPPTGTSGHCRFTRALAVFLRQMRGINCDPVQIIPVTGFDAALDLVLRVLIDQGHCVLVEDPALPGIRERFSGSGARAYSLPPDKTAIESRDAFPPPRLIFCAPSAQFPLGRQMPAERRRAILDLAHSFGSIVFEVDHYWELLLGARERPMHAIDGDEAVLYFGSFTETLGPFLRLAYLVVPPGLVDTFTQMQKRAGHAPEDFVVGTAAAFVESGQYALHIRSARALSARRLELAAAACAGAFPDARVIEPSAGFHLTLAFSSGFDEDAVCRTAQMQGLSVVPLSAFYAAPTNRRGLVLGFGAVPDRNINTMVNRLADIVTISHRHTHPADRPEMNA